MNTISFTFNKIILQLSNPLDWEAAKMITGKVDDVGPGRFEMPLSTFNMQRISRAFTGPNKPTVIGGLQFLNGLKDKLAAYKQHRDQVQEVLSKDRYPVPPNGKFFPYAHQTLGVGVIAANPFSPIMLSCGTGKTGTTARTVELCMNKGEVGSGKVLVSAPLSILDVSWADDLNKFTSLRYAKLWTPATNKTVLGEERVVITDYGPKPEDTIKTKKKTGVVYRHKRTGQLQEQITVMDIPRDWTKLQASWKISINLLGEEKPFGEVIGRTAVVEKTKEQFIKDQLARKDVDIYLINHDGVRIYEELLKAHNFDWVIVDESTKIKSPTSKVFRSHVNISWNSKRRNILSGTPNPNGFIDLWAQFYFLDRGMTLEPSLKDYLFEYFKPEIVGYTNGPGGRKAAIKYNIRSNESKQALIDRVRSVGIYLEQRDCIDLPPRTDMRRAVFMTDEQEAAYDRMAIDLVTELKNNQSGKSVQVDAVNVLAKIMKLRQITSGFLIDKSGSSVHLSHNPKLEDLDEFIEELGDKKIVIAAQFREEVRNLVERYRDRGARAIYGDVPVEERSRIIREFQKEETCRLIVLQPAAAAHGITLTAASHLVFTSLDYNFEYYYQTAKRIERIGQKNPIFVIHMISRYKDGSATIDEDLLDVLAAKRHDRDALFSESSLGDIANQLTTTLIRQVEARHGSK